MAGETKSGGVRAALEAAARERILILDGAMGTQIQGLGFGEDDFTGHGACASTAIRSRATTTS